MNQKRLTLADLPKEYLVGIIEAIQLPVEEELIAGAIIEHRLHRAGIHAGRYKEINETAKKTRQMRNRRDLEIQAQRHAVNFTTLFESAKKMADEYGLTEKYFHSWKKKAGAAIGQTTRRPHHET